MKENTAKFEKTKELIIKHYQKYPKLQITDIFKYLFQSSFGCEHLSPEEKTAANYIRMEYSQSKNTDTATVDELDGAYSRVPLSCLNGELTPETLAKLFCYSAKTEKEGKKELLDKISVVRELINDGRLPFSTDEFITALDRWSGDGYQAVHHSEVFRAEYTPAYRVISNEYVSFLPLFSQIDKALSVGKTIIAIEGGSASGKTTLSKMLEGIYGCTVFHMDDFFLRPEQRTPERLAEAGGNVDRERFLDEVLKPCSEGKDVLYRRFDCTTQTVCQPIVITPKQLTVVEGAYSMHPTLSPYYTFSVFLDVESEYQKERINKRNTPKMATRFFNEWIPLEHKYFSEMSIKEKCNLVIPIKKQV